MEPCLERWQTPRAVADSPSDQAIVSPSRRRSARDYWAFVRLPLLGTGFVLALVLGYLGAAQSPSVPAGFVDRLYAAMQLFALESNVADPVPAAYQIARFAAPLLIGAAAVGAVLVLFREETLRARAALGRNQTIIVGLGERGLRLARSLSEDTRHRDRVVAIEIARNSDALAEAAAVKVPVFAGDGTDSGTLRRAGIRRASHVVFATPDDLVNLEGAAAVANALGDRGSIVAHVLVRDVELWRGLSPTALHLSSGRVAVEFVSVEHRAARDLVAALDNDAFGGEQALLLVAEGALGEAVVAHAVRRAQKVGVERLRVTLVSEDANELLTRWRARNPAMQAVADIVPINASVGALTPELLAAAMSASAAIIALPNPRVALAAALHLNTRRAVPLGGLVLAVPDHRVGQPLRDGTMLGIKVVGVLSGTLDARLLAEGTRERIARARHAHYVIAREAEGATPENTPALQVWEVLDDSFKKANRAFAGRVVEALEGLNATLVPIAIGPMPTTALTLPEEEVNRLARQEHDAWVQERRAEGYELGKPRNDDRRTGKLLHPALMDWDQLPADDREKDRESVTNLPEYLAEAGFQIVHLD